MDEQEKNRKFAEYFSHVMLTVGSESSAREERDKYIASVEARLVEPYESLPAPWLPGAAPARWLTAPAGIVAKEWGMRAKRVLRWRRIVQEYIPEGLTQEQMAEKERGHTWTGEALSVEAIKADFRDMRKRAAMP
jgi:hypothetical protein